MCGGVADAMRRGASVALTPCNKARTTMNEPRPMPVETLRLHLANERTFLAWIRTGVALMGFGFAIARFGLFLRQVASAERLGAGATDALGSAWGGTALVALGMLASLGATIRFGVVRRAIDRGDVGAPRAQFVYAMGWVAALVGLTLGILLARALGR
jgi:putative membrane protein